jgi:hypothetical protein
MKYHACALLFFVNFLLSNYVITDKSQRIGRFNHEDFFDENLVQEVLNCSPSVVKKYVKKLLYADSDDYEFPEQILLLGKSKISTTAIAKAMALRAGYDYYVIEASALLKAYYNGKQRLLAEVVPIRKQVRPIALIITELPELMEYSGLLESILWRFIGKCAFMSDTLIIGTSRLQKEQLSQDMLDQFGDDIISLELDQMAQKRTEKIVSKTSWIEKNKIPCLIAAGLLCCAVTTGYLFTQIVCAVQVLTQLKYENGLLRQEINNLSNEIGTMPNADKTQSQLDDMQKQLTQAEKESCMSQPMYWELLREEKPKEEEDDDMLDSTHPFYVNQDLDDEDDED